MCMCVQECICVDMLEDFHSENEISILWKKTNNTSFLKMIHMDEKLVKYCRQSYHKIPACEASFKAKP